MRSQEDPPYSSLDKICRNRTSSINEESIGFMIGPRLIAAGRLGDAYPAVNLLITNDITIAIGFAEAFDSLNKERQAIVSRLRKKRRSLFRKCTENTIPSVFVIAKEGWNWGVVGIVASRITENIIVLRLFLSIYPETGIAKGSARSIEGFNMYEELTENADFLPHWWTSNGSWYYA